MKSIYDDRNRPCTFFGVNFGIVILYWNLSLCSSLFNHTCYATGMKIAKSFLHIFNCAMSLSLSENTDKVAILLRIVTCCLAYWSYEKDSIYMKKCYCYYKEFYMLFSFLFTKNNEKNEWKWCSGFWHIVIVLLKNKGGKKSIEILFFFINSVLSIRSAWFRIFFYLHSCWFTVRKKPQQ